MSIYTDSGVTSGLNYWRSNIWLGDPLVWYNANSTTTTNNTVVMAPGTLAWHPGPNGEFSLIRFTAPSAGNYSISASFFGVDDHGTTTDVHILVNGSSIFDGAVNGFGPGSGPSDSAVVSLAAGGLIDFAVGRGADNDFSFDSTGISAQILPVPEPSVAALLGLGLGALAALPRFGLARGHKPRSS